MGLSKKQSEILDVIRRWIAEKGYCPSIRELCAEVRLSSPSTVHAHLRELENQGYITRPDGKNRSIVLTGGREPAGVPILGRVAAGAPILAQQEIRGYLPWDPRGEGEFVALAVRGDSMKDAGILDGDLVVVRQQETAGDGEIVIALLEEEATCKRLSLEDGAVWLLPENEAYEPIDGTGARILGKVTAVIRTY